MANRIQLSDDAIRELYVEQKLSARQISRLAGCSEMGIHHRLNKLGVEKRSISEGVYVRCNPGGDPFAFKMPLTAEDWRLFGAGLGLYWGEGTKASTSSVRIANTDPRLLRAFMDFMQRFFSMGREKAKAHIQLFTDIDVTEASGFWREQLGLEARQFTKPIVTPSGSMGTHRNKSRYGVATLHYQNTKLRNLLIGELAGFARAYGPSMQLTVPRQPLNDAALASKKQ